MGYGNCFRNALQESHQEATMTRHVTVGKLSKSTLCAPGNIVNLRGTIFRGPAKKVRVEEANTADGQKNDYSSD